MAQAPRKGRKISVAPDKPEEPLTHPSAPADGAPAQTPDPARAAAPAADAYLDDEEDFEGPVHGAPNRSVHQSNETTEADDSIHAEWDDFDFNGMRLTAPPPRDGYKQRWIRDGFRDGSRDNTNVAEQYRRGWRPRPLSTIPDNFTPTGPMPIGEEGTFRVGGCVLCERPIAVHEKAKAQVMAHTRRLEQSVDAELSKVERDRVPFTRVSQTHVVGGR